MRIDPFALERFQSLYENTVEYNLTETGVHPLTIDELFNPEEQAALHQVRLGYGQTNGDPELRRRIAAMYPGADEDCVTVTCGSAEANFISMWDLLEPGDELVVMLPNYMQIWGLGRAFGAVVKPFHLKESLGWQPDPAEVEELVTDKTKVIALCHPNNPTGAVLTEATMDKLIALADKVGAWIYADEIYRGAELEGEALTPSFHGRYDKALVTGSFSKAYAMPGIRIGWLVGPREAIAAAWARRDYLTIASSVLSQKIATMVLAPDKLAWLLKRNRGLLGRNLEMITAWAAGHGDLFSFIPPTAGGIVFLHYDLEIGSSALSDKLRLEKSTFVVPGDWFGLDKYIRLGIGGETDYIKTALGRVDQVLEELK